MDPTDLSPSPQGPEAPAPPPIITYPEFLSHSAAPPPIVTARRIVNSLYIFSATAATIYGTSKYLIQPMNAQLTAARHSLAETARTNLQKLNEQLEGLVSEIPDLEAVVAASRAEETEKEKDDSASSTSDPTELFHVDTGTQTSPPPPRRPRSLTASTSSSSSPSLPLSSSSPLTAHQTALRALETHLATLTTSITTASPTTASTLVSLADLTKYLQSLAYHSGPYRYPPPSSNVHGAAGQAVKDDPVADVKADIRAVKGVLLSARNFPAGGGAVVVPAWKAGRTGGGRSA